MIYYNSMGTQIRESEVALQLQQIKVVLPFALQPRAEDDHQAGQVEAAERHKNGEISVLVGVGGGCHDVLQQACQRVARIDISWQLLPHVLPED